MIAALTAIGVFGPAQAQSPTANVLKQNTAAASENCSLNNALSREPAFDGGTALPTREALIVYKEIALRSGLSAILSDAKFAIGAVGLNDELLRRRLFASGD